MNSKIDIKVISYEGPVKGNENLSKYVVKINGSDYVVHDGTSYISKGPYTDIKSQVGSEYLTTTALYDGICHGKISSFFVDEQLHKAIEQFNKVRAFKGALAPETLKTFEDIIDEL